MENRQAILGTILSTSGSGKTHFIQTSRFGPILQDMDMVPAVHDVYKSLYRAYGDKWWDRPEHEEMKVRLFADLRPKIEKQYRKGTLPLIFLTAESELIIGKPAHVVIPIERRLLNMESRAEAKDDHHPIMSKAELIEDTERLRNLIPNVPEFDTFEAATTYLLSPGGDELFIKGAFPLVTGELS
jgi:hypothetical protein